MKKNLLTLLLLPLLVGCGETATSAATKTSEQSNATKTTEKASESVAASSTNSAAAAASSSSAAEEDPGTLVLEAEFSPDIEWAEDYPGFSGSQSGANIIVPDRDGSFGASNGFYVSYLYKYGATIGFTVTASKACTAKLTWRISAEFFNNQTYTMADNEITVNDTPVVYAQISYNNVPSQSDGRNQPFEDKKLGTINLVEGENKIVYTTKNNTVPGGTMQSTAPIIDCFKLTDFGDATLEFSDKKTDYEVF
jgi:hypothetical protein